MGMASLIALKFADFLPKKYQSVAEDHSGSSISWVKARWHGPEGIETAKTGLEKGGLGVGTIVGIAGLATAGATALSLGVVAVVVPLGLTLGVIGWWAADKKGHHLVNTKIWKFFCAHRDKDGFHLKPDAKLELPEAKEYLAWFGEEGIGNMDRLPEKLQQAAQKYNASCSQLSGKIQALWQRVHSGGQVRQSNPAAQQAQQLQLRTELDRLADEFMELAGPLMYVRYRLDRYFMYHEMLQLIMTTLQKEMSDKLPGAEQTAQEFCDDTEDNYEKLLRGLICIEKALEPQPAKR